jgi:hypothetical protein
VVKRMMTGTEAAVQDANRHEAVRKKEEKEQEDLQRTEEAKIDDELLAGIGSEEEDINSDHSEVQEIIFSTLVSPSRATGAMLLPPPPRPTTPVTAEVARKRSFTLVDRTPEKPRGVPISTGMNLIRLERSPEPEPEP